MSEEGRVGVAGLLKFYRRLTGAFVFEITKSPGTSGYSAARQKGQGFWQRCQNQSACKL